MKYKNDHKPTGKNRYAKQMSSRVRKITRSQREQIGLAYYFRLCDIRRLQHQYNISRSYVYKLGGDFGRLDRDKIGALLLAHPEMLALIKESKPDIYRQVLEWFPFLADCEPADDASQNARLEGGGGGRSEREVINAILSFAVEHQSSSEKISTTLKDVLGLLLSRSTIDNIIQRYGVLAAEINKQYDCIVMPKTSTVALDEIFKSNGEPILTMIDLDSTYVLAISPQHDRKKETWETLLLCLQEDCGLNPETFISDECGCILVAAGDTFEAATILLDIFHILKDLWDSGKYCRAKYQKILNDLKDIENRVQAGVKIQNKTIAKWEELLKEEPEVRCVLDSLTILRGWISELLGYTGYTASEVKELLLFCLDELDIIAGTSKNGSGNGQAAGSSVVGSIHYKKFGKAIDTFRQKIDTSLGYLGVFEKNLNGAAAASGIDPELAWHVYRLRRYEANSAPYYAAAALVRKQCRCTEKQLRDAMDLVDKVVAASKRASSLVECLNSRVRRILDSKKKVSDAFFELVRLYFNCRPYPRSRVAERRHKSPIELATGEKVNFFELLATAEAKQKAAA